MLSIFGKKLSGTAVFNLATIILSVGLIAYFALSQDGLVSLARNIRDFKIIWLVFAFLCMNMDLVLDTVLIYIFTKNIQKKYTLAHAFKVCMVGHLYSAITPFQSGGQPMQIFVMTKQGVDPGHATSALVQKFFVYQTGIAIYSLFAIIFRLRYFRNRLNPLMWSLTAIGFTAQVAMGIFLLIVSFNEKITHKLLSLACRLLSKMHLIKKPEETTASWGKQLDYFHESNQYLYKNKFLLIKTYIITFFSLHRCLWSPTAFTALSTSGGLPWPTWSARRHL